jgi:hypothetical protein
MTASVPPSTTLPAPGSQPLTEGPVASGESRSGGRLLAIRSGIGAERVLKPPVTARLQPAAIGGSAAENAPRPAVGVQVEARLLGPTGRPVGAAALVWLSAAEVAARAAVAEGSAPGQPSGQVTGGAVLAEVVGHDSSGRPLLRAPGLSLRLDAPLDLPGGARLQLTLPHAFAPPAPADAQAAPDDDPLRRVIEALLRRPPRSVEGHEAGALRLPAVDHALAARLLRWVQALRASVVPPQAEPDDGLEPSAGALRSALGALARHAQEPQAGGWRVLLMPLGVAEPQPLRLYLREVPPDPERDRQAERDRHTTRRVIFEVELSRLGRCQLDVLCRAARFDLVVRTEAPLAAASQDDIRVLVQAASEVAGFAGKVEFRAAGLLPLPAPHSAMARRITA